MMKFPINAPVLIKLVALAFLNDQLLKTKYD